MNFALPPLRSIGYNYAGPETVPFMVRSKLAKHQRTQQQRIDHQVEPERQVDRIELLANLSWSLDRLAGFFLVLSAVTLSVALLPTLLGYWPIMAVAIVHLAIVGWCFRLAWRGNWARQDVLIDRERIRVLTSTHKKQDRLEWPVQWVRVETECVRGEVRTFLALHGQRCEIGRFLSDAERSEAATLINRALAPYSAWRDQPKDETASAG